VVVALVLDTGVLYAALDIEDPDHEACAQLLERSEEELVVPEPVLVELDYWIRKFASADAWLAFCEDVRAGAYVLAPLDAHRLVATTELQVKHASLPLNFVDAAVFTTCEALGERKVATLDRRDFGTLRTATGEALELLPA